MLFTLKDLKKIEKDFEKLKKLPRNKGYLKFRSKNKRYFLMVRVKDSDIFEYTETAVWRIEFTGYSIKIDEYNPIEMENEDCYTEMLVKDLQELEFGERLKNGKKKIFSKWQNENGSFKPVLLNKVSD